MRNGSHGGKSAFVVNHFFELAFSACSDFYFSSLVCLKIGCGISCGVLYNAYQLKFINIIRIDAHLFFL